MNDLDRREIVVALLVAIGLTVIAAATIVAIRLWS